MYLDVPLLDCGGRLSVHTLVPPYTKSRSVRKSTANSSGYRTDVEVSSPIRVHNDEGLRHSL